MDFTFRCNSLKCRTQLNDRAVVTTCSHIFCNGCSDSLGLTAPVGGHRICPACQTSLPNPDDAVCTQLNPTEDYKTSVLSGLTPSTIMECAGRGLAFWSYQSTQEIVYQEYLAKTLTDKYGNLNVQVDKIVNDANAELEILHQKLAVMQIDQDKLKTENTSLVAAFREKSRKHQQTQELYDRLKRKEMTAATQSAAFDSVDEVLGSISSRSYQDPNHPNVSQQYQSVSRPPGQQDFYHSPVDVHGQQQMYTHGRSGSNGSQGSKGLMPPPPNPTNKPGNRAFEFTQSRPQAGSIQQSGIQPNTGNYINPGRIAAGRLQQTPSQRQPFANVGNSSLNRSGVSGYGMSAGMKVGRQQAPRTVGLANHGQERGRSRITHPFAQSQVVHQNEGTYY